MWCIVWLGHLYGDVTSGEGAAGKAGGNSHLQGTEIINTWIVQTWHVILCNVYRDMSIYLYISGHATQSCIARCVSRLRRETDEGAQLYIPSTCQSSHFAHFAPQAPGRSICHARKHGKHAMHRLGPQDHEHSASTDHCPGLVGAGGVVAHIVAKVSGASAPVDLAVALHLVARRSRPRGPRQAARVGQRL